MEGDRPSEVITSPSKSVSQLTKQQRRTVRQLGATIKAYRAATEKLLAEKYAHIRPLVPQYLSEPGNMFAYLCSDGLIIRFERRVGESKVLVGWAPEPLSTFAPLISQGLVYCHPSRDYTSSVATTGMDISVGVFDQDGLKKHDLFSIKVGFDSVIERPEQLPKPPQKPFCLLSVRNAFEFQFHGVLMDEAATDTRTGQPFLMRSEMRLPVGWECIEVYPFFDVAQWKPEWAPLWAENDILAAVLTRQMQESHYMSLDPNASARRQFGLLLGRYRELLDSNPAEELLQKFMKEVPVLLCPSYQRVWPKLNLGARQTDFVFRQAAGDYILVELEQSTHRLFGKAGHPLKELTHAQGQIADWKRYLEDNLATVQRELGLDDISVNPHSVIVIGRSSSLTDANRRKLVTMANASPTVKILTYDDVYDNAKAMIENMLGPLWDGGGETQIYYPPRPAVIAPTPSP